MINHCTQDKIQKDDQGRMYFPEELLLKQREEWLKKADAFDPTDNGNEFAEAMEQVWIFTVDASRSRKMAAAA